MGKMRLVCMQMALSNADRQSMRHHQWYGPRVSEREMFLGMAYI